jgi:hypothetical protein
MKSQCKKKKKKLKTKLKTKKVKINKRTKKREKNNRSILLLQFITSSGKERNYEYNMELVR